MVDRNRHLVHTEIQSRCHILFTDHASIEQYQECNNTLQCHTWYRIYLKVNREQSFFSFLQDGGNLIQNADPDICNSLYQQQNNSNSSKN